MISFFNRSVASLIDGERDYHSIPQWFNNKNPEFNKSVQALLNAYDELEYTYNKALLKG